MAISENPSEKKTAAKAPRKAAAEAKLPAVAKKPAAGRSRKAKTAEPQESAPPQVSAEERYRMTEVAAYFMAERNNFAGNPVEYWRAAEAQVSSMLGQR